LRANAPLEKKFYSLPRFITGSSNLRILAWCSRGMGHDVTLLTLPYSEWHKKKISSPSVSAYFIRMMRFKTFIAFGETCFDAGYAIFIVYAHMAPCMQ
jgi:hypothetical protein